jgi:hypothetical protein
MIDLDKLDKLDKEVDELLENETFESYTDEMKARYNLAASLQKYYKLIDKVTELVKQTAIEKLEMAVFTRHEIQCSNCGTKDYMAMYNPTAAAEGRWRLVG